MKTMKFTSWTLSMMTVFFLSSAYAQKAEIKDIGLDGEEETTISVKKGKAGSTEKEFDIINGTADVAGDSNPLTKGAKDSWKKACTEWKTELKELNKDNIILSMNCGSANCKKEEHGSTCSSTATYQLKVRMRK